MTRVVNWMRLTAVATLASCGDDPTFRCARDEQCVLDDVAGVCEPSGYCTVPDPSCDGRRYTESAGDGLAGVCLHVSVFGETSDADFRGVTTDAELRSAEPGANFGGSDNLSVHGLTLTSLLRFELAALPPTAIIEVAELRVHLANTGELSIEMFPLVEAWDELGATWAERMPGMPWSDPGAGERSRSSVLVGSFAATNLGPVTTVLAPAAVQAWVDDPSSNLGMVLSTRTEAGATLASSQEGMTSLRPHLVVTWR